ncbi:hypothetical protein [Eikenella corrodens]|jgi:hypothetical protein|uniref:hypothetical protein n=1 Tax=Eikenella corrodens TaxID=539 RepID=UPI0007D04AF1|nr:hypothetical protein [Eikenella corrodens]OAM18555.1 hypothetical protein A7P84_07010 [Eikenella corrodens]
MRVVYVIQELTEGAFIGVDGLGGLEYVRKLDEAFRFRNLNVALDHGRDVDSSLRNVAFYPLYEPE